MCCGCWEEMGAHKEVTNAVKLTADIIKKNMDLLEFGPCHICIEDDNIEDENLQYCWDQCDKERKVTQPWESKAGFDDEAIACRIVIGLLSSLSYEERVAVVGLYEGCFEEQA